MEMTLKKINYGYDGLIRDIKIHNLKTVEITISAMDFENEEEWINVSFIIQGLKEFKISQKINFSNEVLSGGIKLKKINGVMYIDFAPYSDDIETIEDFRFSDIYFGGDSIEWEINPYSE